MPSLKGYSPVRGNVRDSVTDKRVPVSEKRGTAATVEGSTQKDRLICDKKPPLIFSEEAAFLR